MRCACVRFSSLVPIDGAPMQSELSGDEEGLATVCSRQERAGDMLAGRAGWQDVTLLQDTLAWKMGRWRERMRAREAG